MTGQPFSPRFENGYHPLDDEELQRVIDACSNAWLTEPLCRTRKCAFTVMELKGEYIWHQHDYEDEAFHVIIGNLQVELETGVVDVQAGHSFTAHAGTPHRPRASERTVVLVVEGRPENPDN